MGNEITGGRTVIATKLGSTFGTATVVGSGSKFEVENFTWGYDAEELRQNPIGSGQIADNDASRGATTPKFTVDKTATYGDATLGWYSQFFGAESLMNMGGGNYTHSYYLNTAYNSKYATIAFEAFSATGGLVEGQSAVITKITERWENPPNYAKTTFEGLVNEWYITGQTNAFSDLEGATFAETAANGRVVVNLSDTFWINAQGGAALSSGDSVAVKSAVLEFTKNQEFVREIKGSAGYGAPIPQGEPPFSWTLTIQLARHADFTWLTAQNNATEYKALVKTSGNSSRTRTFYLPRLKIISDVKYDLTSSALNPVTVVFKGLVATAAPTGMTSPYPYMIVQNTATTVY